MSCVNTLAYDFSAYLANILSPPTGNSDSTVPNSVQFRIILQGLHRRNQQTYVGENLGTRQGHLGFRPKECRSHDSHAVAHSGTCVDRDPHFYTRKVKEEIHIRRHPNNIYRDSENGIPEA